MSASRWVVVDDSNPNITYAGPWFQSTPNTLDNVGTFGFTYLGISHGTNGTSSLSYAFQGSAVDVFGTSNINNSSGVIDPSWECFIDGVSIVATTPSPSAENNWPLCTWNGTVGSHVLTMNVMSAGHSFWFDWLRYQSPPSASLQDAVVYLDHQDAAIKYDASWQALGGTANMTTKQGSTVTLDFIGTRLSWYSLIPTELPHSASLASFTIDGQTTDFLLQGLNASKTLYNQRFFRTPILSSSGPHELVVTFHGDESSTPLTLTYILIQDGNLSISPYNFSSSTASSEATASSSSSPTGISSTGKTSQPSSTRVSSGAIAGGTVGSLALLCLLFVIYYRKRRRTPGPLSDPVKKALIEPFHTSGSPTLPVQNNGYSHTAGTNNKPAAPASQPSVQSHDPQSGAITSSVEPSSHATSRKQMEASSIQATATTVQISSPDTPAPRQHTVPTEGTSESRSRVVLHQDSGIRLPSRGEDEVVEVPPLYTPG